MPSHNTRIIIIREMNNNKDGVRQRFEEKTIIIHLSVHTVDDRKDKSKYSCSRLALNYGLFGTWQHRLTISHFGQRIFFFFLFSPNINFIGSLFSETIIPNLFRTNETNIIFYF